MVWFVFIEGLDDIYGSQNIWASRKSLKLSPNQESKELLWKTTCIDDRVLHREEKTKKSRWWKIGHDEEVA